MNPVYLAPEVHHCLSLARVSAVICAEQHRGVDFHALLCDVVPELAARHCLASGASVSESTLWDHVGLRAGLSVSSAAVPSAAEKK